MSRLTMSLFDCYSGDAVEIKNGEGDTIVLEKIEVSRETKPSGKSVVVYACDFSTYVECLWCLGYRQEGGVIKASAGLLQVFAVDAHKTWWRMAVACPKCAYGAWQHARQHGSRKIPFDGQAEYIPAGLNQDTWRWLGASRLQGDGYLEAAERLPYDLRMDAAGKINRWLAGHPPRFTVERARKAKRCPEGPRAEHLEPVVDDLPF